MARVVVRPNAVDMELQETPQKTIETDNDAPPVTPDVRAYPELAASSASGTVINLPWSAPAFLSVKGVLHQPDAKATLKPETREAILLAIAKGRSWIEDLASGRVRSFAEIAGREGRCERYIRLLAPLAFVSPRIVAAIAGGMAPADLTVTGLAKGLPYSWAEQEKKIGLAGQDPANT